jgi:hypothetical protein
MRHPLFRLLLLVSAAASLVFAASASAATFTDRASLSRHGRVVFGQPTGANVNVHMRFASISRVCFFFTLEDDLIDPGEELDISSRTGGELFGQTTPGQEPVASFATCITTGFHPKTALFLDGKEKLILSMFDGGSVRVDRLEVVIEGVPA